MHLLSTVSVSQWGLLAPIGRFERPENWTLPLGVASAPTAAGCGRVGLDGKVLGPVGILQERGAHWAVRLLEWALPVAQSQCRGGSGARKAVWPRPQI